MEVRKDFSVSSLHLVIQSENFRFGFLNEKINSLPVGSKIWEIISTSENRREFIKIYEMQICFSNHSLVYNFHQLVNFSSMDVDDHGSIRIAAYKIYETQICFSKL